MRIGIGCIPGEYTHFRRWAQTAESCGFDVIGTGDSSTLWTDPFVTLAVAATCTTDIGLTVTGTNPVTRHAVAAAGAIESVQLLSGGRCTYALGSGDSSVATIGQRRATLAELETYGRTVQGLCAGGTERLPNQFADQSTVLRYAKRPVPVFLCAEGPNTQQLAGRFFDGAVLYNGLTEEVVRESVANVARGADESGRSMDELELWWPVVFHLADDVASGVEAVKFSLAGTANRAFRRSLQDKLVPERLHAGFRGLQSEYRSTHHQQLGDHSFNASLVDKYGLTGYLADRFAVVGPMEHCVERLQEMASYGVANVSISILSQDLPGQIESMQRMGELMLPHLK